MRLQRVGAGARSLLRLQMYFCYARLKLCVYVFLEWPLRMIV